jgi:pyruvate dehydrogenase (quinone)
MRVEGGYPKFTPSQGLPRFNYGAYAESVGLRGIRMERPEDVGPGWDAALGSDRPVVVDALVDPNVSQLPPHITFEQAHNLFSALAKGDPDESGVIAESLKSLMASFSPYASRR